MKSGFPKIEDKKDIDIGHCVILRHFKLDFGAFQFKSAFSKPLCS